MAGSITLNLPVTQNSPSFHLLGPSSENLPSQLMVGDRADIDIGNGEIQGGGVQLNLSPDVDFKPEVESTLVMRFSYGGTELLVLTGTGTDQDDPYDIFHTPTSGSYQDLFDAIAGLTTPVVLTLEHPSLEVRLPVAATFSSQAASATAALTKRSVGPAKPVAAEFFGVAGTLTVALIKELRSTTIPTRVSGSFVHSGVWSRD